MDGDKIKRLENELLRYEKKLSEMQKNWSASKEGSRYGDEYLETQIKVYHAMVIEIKKELLALKRGKQ